MKRFYFALTNFCNRSCELCSCFSDPTRKTFITATNFYKYLVEDYEIQLEGGEPLIHPLFYSFLEYVEHDPLCKRVILCTNSVKVPWKYTNGELDIVKSKDALLKWFTLFNKKPFTLKPSINKHLVDHDKYHYQKMQVLQEAFKEFQWQVPAELIFNVRRLKNEDGSPADADILENLKQYDLLDASQVYFYQRYGKAEHNEELDLPYVIQHPVDFYLISPDGLDFKTDLVSRAEHMKTLE